MDRSAFFIKRAGLSLIEVLVALSIFSLVGVASYVIGNSAVRGIHIYRETATTAALADKYMEIARNLPYSQMGTVHGNPSGALPDSASPLAVSYNNLNYQVFYEITNMTDPSSPGGQVDYKQVKVSLKNSATGHTVSFVTLMTPKGLATNTGGALSIKVFDAVGQPVSGAQIHITNSATTPTIDLTRTTDANGNWVEIGLSTSTTNYHVTATKNGYSSDQTYAVSAQNPNPAKPDATVAAGQVTGMSFSIDYTSGLQLAAVDQTCHPLSGVGIRLTGAKLIGTPSLLKFDTTYATDALGIISLNPLEWDNYTPTLSSSSNMIYGSSPIQQINLLPNTQQLATLIVGPTTPNSLLVIVKDGSTGNAIEGATVELSQATLGYDVSALTEGSILYQKDWSGGPGQANVIDPTKYSQDSGSVNIATLPTALRLAISGGSYATSSWLTSSSFDTGTASSSYTMLTWNPTSQTPSTTVAFQIATNNDNATWNYVGPDGTASSVYTVPGTTISTTNNNTRYFRYKALLSSTSTTTTPVLSNVTVNYVSGCAAPGQAMFAGLTTNVNYTVSISALGYTTQTISPISIGGQKVLQVLLMP